MNRKEDWIAQAFQMEAERDRLRAANTNLLAILQQIRDSYSGYIPDFVEAIDDAIAKAKNES